MYIMYESSHKSKKDSNAKPPFEVEEKSTMMPKSPLQLIWLLPNVTHITHVHHSGRLSSPWRQPPPTPLRPGQPCRQRPKRLWIIYGCTTYTMADLLAFINGNGGESDVCKISSKSANAKAPEINNLLVGRNSIREEIFLGRKLSNLISGNWLP